eukprot:CAMPEP_0183394174 /NCGR_PEP_ID=MMETSP0370-20130417/8389_1 /TAXON_ID=268820 /ORGANISM="Peridinium aciculiferum, Strain PAER-2" /LENGTH=158 /DNA_ID=CAMNT_0025574505 /DNA_START=559 /DNA_END=1032 /DNA_ORIENTATION=+
MPRVMVGCGCWLICMFMDLASVRALTARGRSPSTAGDCPGAAAAAARAMGLLAAATAGAESLSWRPIDPSNLDSTETPNLASDMDWPAAGSKLSSTGLGKASRSPMRSRHIKSASTRPQGAEWYASHRRVSSVAAAPELLDRLPQRLVPASDEGRLAS